MADLTTEAIAWLRPLEIALDPQRFQFRLAAGRGGDTGRLGGITCWDPDLAGLVSVWYDPADSRPYVVNGHHRVLLARRLQVPTLLVRYLSVGDAIQARRIGALQNIAEGTANALDTARFLRDSQLTTLEQVSALGLPLRSGMAAEGLALASLPEAAFEAVVQGRLTVSQGVILGGSGLDVSRQLELLRVVQQRPELPDAHLRELVAIARVAEQVLAPQLDLFGSPQVGDSLLTRARLTASLRRRLSEERQLFTTVSRRRAATQLQRVQGNRIDVSASSQVADEATRLLALFDQFKAIAGPVSDALNRAVARVEAGARYTAVLPQLQTEVVQALATLLDGGMVSSKDPDRVA